MLEDLSYNDINDIYNCARDIHEFNELEAEAFQSILVMKKIKHFDDSLYIVIVRFVKVKYILEAVRSEADPEAARYDSERWTKQDPVEYWDDTDYTNNFYDLSKYYYYPTDMNSANLIKLSEFPPSINIKPSDIKFIPVHFQPDLYSCLNEILLYSRSILK
jgi:hypothetical protein